VLHRAEQLTWGCNRRKLRITHIVARARRWCRRPVQHIGWPLSSTRGSNEATPANRWLLF